MSESNPTRPVEDEILRLRFLDHGMTFIAKKLGVSVTRVRGVIQRDAESRAGTREELRQRMAAELDWLARPLKEQYLKDAEKGRVNREDALAILKIAESKKRLEGLDQPARVDVHHSVESKSDEELVAELARHGVTVKQLPAAVVRDQIPESVVEAEFEVVRDGRVRNPKGSQSPTPLPIDSTVDSAVDGETADAED